MFSYLALVFDFDGVIVESMDVKGEAFKALYKPFSQEIAEKVLEHHHHNGGMNRYDKIRYYHHTFLGQALSNDEITLWAQKYSQMVEEAVVQCELVAGVQGFLEKYHTRVPCFIASATPAQELKRIAEKKNLTKYFREIFGYPTKKTEALQSVAYQLEAPLPRILMVGDARADFEAAQAVGTSFVGRITPLSAQIFPASVPLIRDFREFEKILIMV